MVAKLPRAFVRKILLQGNRREETEAVGRTKGQAGKLAL